MSERLSFTQDGREHLLRTTPEENALDDYTLVDVWNHEMNDDFAIDGVMRSLSPQFQELCWRLCRGKGFDHFL